MKFPYWHPVGLETRISDLDGVSVLCFQEGDPEGIVAYGWSVRDDQGKVTYRFTYARTAAPRRTTTLTFSSDTSLGQVGIPLVGQPMVAVATPAWQSRTKLPMRPGHWAVLASVFITISTVMLVLGGSANALFALPAGALVALFLAPLVRPRGRFSMRAAGELQLDEHNVVAYAQARLAGERPEMRRLEDRRQAIVARVDDIRTEYVALREDIVYRIDFPALFDPQAPTTRELQESLLAFDDVAESGSVEELERAASDIEIRYATARRHAETVGDHHLPADVRDDARRAAKAARLARQAATEGERVAAMTQVKRILDSLALHHLPTIDEVRELEHRPQASAADVG